MSESAHRRTVFIIDDDASVRDALSLLLSLRGYATAVFACAEDFLGALAPGWSGCVVADIRMPGMSGLDLQQVLASRPQPLPLIVITGHGDVAAARQALKAHAVDFLEKPLDHDRLLQGIDAALGGLPGARESGGGLAERDALESLSARERQVMGLIIEGLNNQHIADKLGISPRTVEVHKARVMSKLRARNFAELMRIAHTAGHLK